MIFAFGALFLAFVLWKTWKPGRWPVLPPPRRLAAYAAYASAVLMLVRGQAAPGLGLFGFGLWLGRDWDQGGRWLARCFGARRPSAMVRPVLGPDGRPVDGIVRSGPFAGRTLAGLDVGALIGLREACRASDPASAAVLEAYLDGRSPGWRVDAQADRDARPRRPFQPGTMTEQEAHEILGLERGATLQQVRTAHRALMKRTHPDQGGSAEQAARINAARDRLTSRHR